MIVPQKIALMCLYIKNVISSNTNLSPLSKQIHNSICLSGLLELSCPPLCLRFLLFVITLQTFLSARVSSALVW